MTLLFIRPIIINIIIVVVVIITINPCVTKFGVSR